MLFLVLMTLPLRRVLVPVPTSHSARSIAREEGAGLRLSGLPIVVAGDLMLDESSSAA
jgi:hypothetical protein